MNTEKTERLYYLEPYQNTFEAEVVSCMQTDSGCSVILNRTLFYPEGGGQPADTGLLQTEAEDIGVTHVYEENGFVIHTTDKPLTPGTRVKGIIDWARRFSFMQQHTGEHIVSGIIDSLYNFSNVGFHIGAELVTIDINGVISEDDLAVIESMANDAVYKNIPVSAVFHAPGTLNEAKYRSKKELEGDIRIVTVPGYDACACCGVHAAATGEVGVIKLLITQRYKGGTRIFMLCGGRARRDYADKNRQIYNISALLSVKPTEASEATGRLLFENGALKQKLIETKQELLKLKALRLPESTKCACVFENDLNPDELRAYSVMLNERAGIAAVFTESEAGVYRYALASKTADMRAAANELNKVLNGRGGGRRESVSGSVTAPKEEIEAFINRRAEEWLS